MARVKNLTGVTGEPPVAIVAEKEAAKTSEIDAQRDASSVSPFPNVSPVELAQIVAMMGLGDDPSGPGRALSLVSRCETHLATAAQRYEGFAGAFTENTKAYRATLANDLGLNLDDLPEYVSEQELLARLNSNPLRVKSVELRGPKLWRAFCEETRACLKTTEE